MQMVNEIESWPYAFPASEDFPSSAQRGKVKGRLLVRDRYMNPLLPSLTKQHYFYLLLSIDMNECC